MDTGLSPPGVAEALRFDRYFRSGYVHRDVYTDARIFDQEMRALFGRTWVYIGHESEVPAPNDYVTREIGRRPVILTRTRKGDVAVLINRCTHRGALVCRKPRGNTKRFTCGYHAWSFGTDGSCTSVPLRSGYGEDLDMRELDLARPAHTESYRGFVFASMAQDVPPLVDHLAGARQQLDAWIDRGDRQAIVVRSGAMNFNIHTNWKCVYDNAADGYHTPFSHESMLRVFQDRYGDVDLAYYQQDFDTSPLFIKALGNGHTMLDQRPAMHADSAWGRQHPHPSREQVEAVITERYGKDAAIAKLDASTGSGMNLNIFPNLLIIGNQIQVLEPQAVNRTLVKWYSTTLEGADADINLARMRMQEDFPSFGEVDDAAQFESCQQGMTLVPELEWIDMRRHMTTGAGYTDTDGHWREPVSSDLHQRTYFDAWRRIMGESPLFTA
ncbi:aromatic ring-hydroxylating oxygenase subunit alpha [Rhizobium sp. 9140]|uniref:aromatic ring-hydroxylating oxygenase subunit alpha n=1 Tax=Rhizobium sp. 9140 TaxID=1761900 RepID=UPI000796D1A4|nr:Rieske 2Fe-2S domain-containing protein [Rhizobium sp. 9140]CZT37143.1 Ring hydroxylating alpha subunit (catalytic domain) [Rhizobium sp. 9140]